MSSLSDEMQRDHVGAREQFVELHQRVAGMRRAIPGDHLHAEPAPHARNFAADAAEPDDAQRLAGKLHAFARNPAAGADFAVHARHVAAGGHHQRDRVLGDSGVAVALDGVDANAARGELVDIHVARRAGAEKHDMLERGAARGQRGRQVAVIVDADRVTAEQSRQLVGGERRAMDIDRRIVGAHDLLPHRRQLIVAVDEQRFHDCLSAVREGCRTFGYRPPVTLRSAPVTYDAASDSRNRMVSATSSARPGRPIGSMGVIRSTRPGG